MRQLRRAASIFGGVGRPVPNVGQMALGSLVLAMASTWLMAAPGTARAQTPRRPPNIVFILMDDLGYGDLGCYGQKIVPTPNLDRIASEGTRFVEAYSGNNCCAPSRCSLLTGLHSGHSRVRNNGGALEAGDVTMATVLHKAGYATGAFGKWHLGGVGSAGDPNAHGFDLFYGINPESGGSETHFSPVLYRNGNEEPVAANQNGARGAYGDDLFLDDAVAFIRKHATQPFFVYLALRAPHKALEAPKEAMRKFLGKFEETPFGGDGQVGPVAAPRAARAAMIWHMDQSVPRVFTTLRELGLDRNTLVIFTSDNGPITAGGSDPEFFHSAGGLRGLKFTMYEGGIRVPMIAWWPGTVPAGTTCDLPCAFWDFMPTFAELAGAPCPTTDGISLVPVLKGNVSGQRRHDWLYWERAGVQAVRCGDSKAIRKVRGDKLERFDLKNDTAETTNLAAEGSEADQRMRKLMNESHVDNPQYPLIGPKKKARKRSKPAK